MFSTERFRDWILLLLCNLIWASQFVLVKIVQEQMGPVAATSFPMLIATVLLIPIVRWESRSQQARLPSIPGADWLRFLLIGVLGQVVAQLFITWGLRFSLASNAALLMLTLPIATTVTSLPRRKTLACPKGIRYSSSGTWPLVLYRPLCSRKITGFSSLSPVLINPLTSYGVEGTATLSPGM